MEKTQRISVVDSIRGFAVVGIILIHFLEHMNFYRFPEQTAFDQGVWDTVFYLGANKMYAIFALLFGLSCYIQHHNQDKRGYDFRPRFAWRMLLLFGWGLLDLMFFNGDILCTYAVIGLCLIPLIKASDRTLMIVIAIFFMQPIEMVYIILGLINPAIQPLDLGIGHCWDATYEACANGNMLDVAYANLTNGLQINFGWAIEHGRFTQTYLLFCIGMWLGRRRLFINEADNLHFWKRLLPKMVILFVCVQTLLLTVNFKEMAPAVSQGVETLLTMWRNFAMMMFYVGCLVLLYYCTRARKAIDHLAYIGKMSLSDYLIQSIVGGFIFYNWGLAIYPYTRHSQSFLLAIAFLLCLYAFCRYWTTHHRRGPLEELWARATWIGSHK